MIEKKKEAGPESRVAPLLTTFHVPQHPPWILPGRSSPLSSPPLKPGDIYLQSCERYRLPDPLMQSRRGLTTPKDILGILSSKKRSNGRQRASVGGANDQMWVISRVSSRWAHNAAVNRCWRS